MLKKLINYLKSIRIKIYRVPPPTPQIECYEIWRPNIPDNGCSVQCKECAAKEQQLNFKKIK